MKRTYMEACAGSMCHTMLDAVLRQAGKCRYRCPYNVGDCFFDSVSFVLRSLYGWQVQSSDVRQQAVGLMREAMEEYELLQRQFQQAAVELTGQVLTDEEVYLQMMSSGRERAISIAVSIESIENANHIRYGVRDLRGYMTYMCKPASEGGLWADALIFPWVARTLNINLVVWESRSAQPIEAHMQSENGICVEVARDGEHYEPVMPLMLCN
ncbi:hypothetical protein Vretifemale_11734, partial [Volvox reticuliferus]